MIGIIQYGAGNLFSLASALERMNIAYGMVQTAKEMSGYDRFIIPGVGHGGVAMDHLRFSGLDRPLMETTKPVLGICVGAQLLSQFTEEGNTTMMGVFPLRTRRFAEDLPVKVPHTGWNQVQQTGHDPLFKGIDQEGYFYFVHSYYIELNSTFTIGITQYNHFFSSALRLNNFWGVQFHPEKSGKDGQQVLNNFNDL